MTPRTVRPAARARSASRPASPGGQPQRGRPTFTSISTSGTPARAAASLVASESTATVMRAPARASTPSRVASTTSLANSRSSPSPARTIPSISCTVAQGNPAWPAAAWWEASAVHLCALTCGRSRCPGRASALVPILASSPRASTRSAGVVPSEVFTPGTLPTARAGAATTRRGTLRAVGTPWLGDACGLVDAFRAGELSPLEALEESIAATEASPLNAFSFTDFERATDAARQAEVSLPFGGVPFGVKELEKVEGWPHTEASVIFKDRIADEDDTSLARLRTTGAVLAAQ